MGPYPGDNNGQSRLHTHNGTGMKRLTDAGEAPSDVNPDIRTSRDSLITSQSPPRTSPCTAGLLLAFDCGLHRHEIYDLGAAVRSLETTEHEDA